MIDWLTQYMPAWNSLLALFLYWLPMVVCLIGYAIRIINDTAGDRKKRGAAEASDKGFYVPSVTVGTLVACTLLSIIPIVNLWSAIFDVSPEVTSSIISWFGRLLSVPLVPSRKK